MKMNWKGLPWTLGRLAQGFAGVEGPTLYRFYPMQWPGLQWAGTSLVDSINLRPKLLSYLLHLSMGQCLFLPSKIPCSRLVLAEVRTQTFLQKCESVFPSAEYCTQISGNSSEPWCCEIKHGGHTWNEWSLGKISDRSSVPMTSTSHGKWLKTRESFLRHLADIWRAASKLRWSAYDPEMNVWTTTDSLVSVLHPCLLNFFFFVQQVD